MLFGLLIPPRNRGGIVFSLQFVSVCVCVSGSACEQHFSQMDEPIWTWFLLHGCLLHWLNSYWNWWLWVKGQGHSDVIPIFCLLTSLLCILALLYLIKMKFDLSLRYTLGRFVFKFHKSNGWWRHCEDFLLKIEIR